MGYKKNCCSRVAALVEVSSRNKLGLRKGKGGWGGNIITGGSSGRGRGRSAADSFDCRAHKRRNRHASCARGWYKKNCCSRVAALVEVSSRNKLGLRKGKRKGKAKGKLKRKAKGKREGKAKGKRKGKAKGKRI